MALKRRGRASAASGNGSAPQAAVADKSKRKSGKSAANGPVREVKNWYSDRYQYVLVQRNILAFITLAALGAAAFLSVAISQMAPLKSVKPFVIQVDDKTGITQVVSDESKQELQANEVLKRYFVIKYVNFREGYDASFAQTAYNAVRLMSSRSVFDVYNEYMAAANPQSPVNLYSNKVTKTVKFMSVVFLEPDLAQARISVSYHGQGASGYKESQHVVLVRFKFARLELTQDERDVNPLGFRVEAYQVVQESGL